MRWRFRPRGLRSVTWRPRSGPDRHRYETLSARLGVEIERAALKLVRDIAKRRARALLAELGQLELIAPGLSAMPPRQMVARVEELRCAARSLKCRSDGLAGRVDAHNLNAAALVARLLRRAERREASVRDAA